MTFKVSEIASGCLLDPFDPTEAAGKDANRLTLTERAGNPAPAGGGTSPDHQAPPATDPVEDWMEAMGSWTDLDVTEYTNHKIKEDARRVTFD